MGIEKRRNQSFPSQTVEAFGDVEHQVPAFPPGQPAHQLLRMADAHGPVSQLEKGRLYGLDRSLAVELRGLLLGKAEGQVVAAQIVSQADGEALHGGGCIRGCFSPPVRLSVHFNSFT